MPRLFDAQAPITVRIGSILVLTHSLMYTAAALQPVATEPSATGFSTQLGSGVMRLILGLVWARGIALMETFYYWSWVGLNGILLGLELLVMFGHIANAENFLPPPSWRLIVWVITMMLLLSPPSVRAFWRLRRGHTESGVV